MASAEQLKALLKSHIDGDDPRFFSIAMQVAAHEAKLGHGKLADELRQLIDAAKSRRSAEIFSKNAIPINKPRGEIAQLLDVFYPKLKLSDMVLGINIENRLKRIIKEQLNLAKIKQHGLTPRRKILLMGSPGTGKTMTASVLACELGIPLFLVRLDVLITKYMGETSAKLRQIFDALQDVRGVYFFDEFDAIGAQRALTNDVGEIRRVLNSFLQMIEQDNSNSIIIAATNHPAMLDTALFRRFDDIIEYVLPNIEQIISLMQSKLANYKLEINWESVASIASGLSYADITRAIEETIKDAIIHDIKNIKQAAIEDALSERKTTHNSKQISS